MRLKLNRPICFFDLETTGAKVGKDRIVEIAILRVDICLLYTSDAADDTPCVDLGGRRII